MIGWRRILTVLLTAFVVGGSAALGQEDPREVLTVGTRAVPPFATQNAAGEWEGLAIELWNSSAAAMGYDTAFVEMELDEMLAALERKELDAVAAAITVTYEREAKLDFTHPYFTSGLGIAIVSEQESLFVRLFRRLFSLEFVQALFALAFVLFVAGVLVWIFERKRNADQFGGSPSRGLGAAFWWAAVTMTTVGYGDKAPQTPGGRLVALVWMFASIIVISSFTAAIATSLTIGELSTSIAGPEDLYGKTVGTVDASTSNTYLAERGIQSKRFGTVEESLDRLAEGRLDAVVYDAPVMRYYTNTMADGARDVRVLPREFERQQYAIALWQGSPLREELNRQILDRIAGEWWQTVRQRYLAAE